jgi:adenylate cyclase
LALGVATAIILPLSAFDIGPLRILETTSLDLRFRLRGTQVPGSEIVVILVDDRSLAALGRWPLSRHVFAKAVRAVQKASAKLIVFDLLFAEPDQPLSSDLRDSARAAADRLTDRQDAALSATLSRLAAEDPDRDLAAAIHDSGKVLLPFAFSFSGKPEENPPDYLSDQAYQQLDQSPVAPVFPLEPQSVVTPIAPLAEAAMGFGHVSTSYDRDGAPRYDYLAFPFNGDFLPSMPVRAAASYLGVPWDKVGLALGAGVHMFSRNPDRPSNAPCH